MQLEVGTAIDSRYDVIVADAIMTLHKVYAIRDEVNRFPVCLCIEVMI